MDCAFGLRLKQVAPDCTGLTKPPARPFTARLRGDIKVSCIPYFA